MNYFLWGVIISMLVYLAVGVWSGRSIKNLDDYYVSGRNAGTLLLSGTMLASMISVATFMGDQAWVYTGNLTTLVLMNCIAASGYILGPVVFGRFLRRSECTTMPDYFGARYSDPRNRRVAGIITVISVSTYLLACLNGVGLLMEELTGLSFKVCLFLAWICFTGFTFYSGSKGVVLTNTIMFLLFVLASVLAGKYLFQVQGGLSHLLSNLLENPQAPEHLLDYYGNPAGAGSSDAFGAVMYAVTLGIVWSVAFIVSPWQGGRNIMAKSEHTTIRVGVVSAICMILFFTFLNLETLSILNVHPGMEEPEKVLIWGALNLMPNLVGTLMLAGILAAGLSSASTFLSVIGFSLATDIFQIQFKDEKRQLLFSRITILLAGLIILLLAEIGVGGIRIIAYFASTLIAASWAVPGIGSIVSRKLSATGARWGMISGFLGFVISKCLVGFEIAPFNDIFINFLDPFYIGVICSLVFAVVGSKMEPVGEKEKKYRLELLKLPETEKNASEYKKDKKYALFLIAIGLCYSLFLLFSWALPYNNLLP